MKTKNDQTFPFEQYACVLIQTSIKEKFPIHTFTLNKPTQLNRKFNLKKYCTHIKQVFKGWYV